jgi:hypothetical protein
MPPKARDPRLVALRTISGYAPPNRTRSGGGRSPPGRLASRDGDSRFAQGERSTRARRRAMWFSSLWRPSRLADSCQSLATGLGVFLEAPAEQPRKRSRFPGLSQCAREDSNLHGPFSPQGPQPCASTNSATGAWVGQYRPGKEPNRPRPALAAGESEAVDPPLGAGASAAVGRTRWVALSLSVDRASVLEQMFDVQGLAGQRARS